MYDEESMLKVIDELNGYLKKGSMNRKQIDKTIRCLREVYIRESIVESKINEDNIEDYIRDNLKLTAQILNRSVATVYRKLHDHSFTLTELMLINNMRFVSEENKNDL